MAIRPAEIYNRIMGESTIENLLEVANSSSETDTSINFAKRQFVSESDAAAFFHTTRSRLMSIDAWRKRSSATGYDLFDEDGNSADDRPISIGTFIRIHLYGGGKYDWVRVISIVDEELEFVLTVKPAHDPTALPVDEESISHFFGPEATNNFCVQRDGKVIAFYVIGINEHTNTKFVDGLIEAARNTAVANVGYYSGMQKAVWKEFSSNFLKTDDELKDD